MTNVKTATKPINLALQGGGSHGAMTWGVLDRILEDERLAITAISGTSAGAMNAVALADGMAERRARRRPAGPGAVLEGGQRFRTVFADPAQPAWTG